MTTRERIQKIEARIDALEDRKHDRHMGVGPAPKLDEGTLPSITPENQFLTRAQRNALDSLLNNLRTGRKVNAIKAYRFLTGAGLKESLDAVMGKLR